MSSTAIAATWQLLLGMGILMLGAGLQSTEISLRATLEGFPAPLTGAVMSCYYLGYMLGTALAPRLVRRVGHIRVFAAMAALAAATILAQGLLVAPLPWALLRGLSGLCFAAIYVVAESWLNDRSSRTTRGSLLALYMAVLYVGLGGSQFLLILTDPRTTAPFMLVAILISLAIVPIVIAAQRAPEIALPQKVRYRDLYRNAPVGVVTVTIAGMVTSNVYSMGPVYAKLSGLDTSGVATFMGVSVLAAMLMQYPVGRLSDRIDRRTVIAGICLFATSSAATAALIRSLPHGPLLLLTALFSGSAFTLYSLGVSHVNDHLEPGQMVAASSALLRMNGIGAALSPVLVGGLIAAFGPKVYFAVLAALTAALALYGLWRKTRRSPLPASRKRPLVAAEPHAVTGRVAAGNGENSTRSAERR
ncbi:MAG TPA: MFS transporter [Steroidobacteraceae bacterium]|nr:MFS transporter [Steroidobacteraceae bacterium]